MVRHIMLQVNFNLTVIYNQDNGTLCITCTINLLGCGTLYVIETGPNGLIPQTVFDWNDGLFDITWAENNENILVTGAGDGHVLVWDINQRTVKLI